MSWTLADLSKIETDPNRGRVMDTLLWEIAMMEKIPWETTGQLSKKMVRIQDLPSVGTRKINAAFSETSGTLEQEVENISIFGAYCDVDEVVARVSNTIEDARLINARMHAKAMAYKFNDKFINGDPNTYPEEFKGLKERIEYLRSAAGGSYTGQYIDNGGTAGDGVLLSSAERHNFVDSLHKLCHAVKGHKPDMLLMNSDCLLAIGSALRREQLYQTTKDMFDRVVDLFMGIPLIDIGTTADQTTEIITSTETLEDEAGAESTSIYAVKFGEGEYLWGIQTFALEVKDLGLLQTTPKYRTQIQWPLGLAQIDPYSIARLYAIIPNAST